MVDSTSRFESCLNLVWGTESTTILNRCPLARTTRSSAFYLSINKEKPRDGDGELLLIHCKTATHCNIHARPYRLGHGIPYNRDKTRNDVVVTVKTKRKKA